MLLRPKKAPSISPERRFLCSFSERRVGRSWKVKPSTRRIWFLLKSLGEKTNKCSVLNQKELAGATIKHATFLGAQSLQMLQVGQLEGPGWDVRDPVVAELKNLQSAGQVGGPARLQRRDAIVAEEPEGFRRNLLKRAVHLTSCYTDKPQCIVVKWKSLTKEPNAASVLFYFTTFVLNRLKSQCTALNILVEMWQNMRKRKESSGHVRRIKLTSSSEAEPGRSWSLFPLFCCC